VFVIIGGVKVGDAVLKQVILRYWCGAWWCRLDRQGIATNMKPWKWVALGCLSKSSDSAKIVGWCLTVQVDPPGDCWNPGRMDQTQELASSGTRWLTEWPTTWRRHEMSLLH